MRILIAEDEKNLNRILAKQLTDNGYTVDTALMDRRLWTSLIPNHMMLSFSIS